LCLKKCIITNILTTFEWWRVLHVSTKLTEIYQYQLNHITIGSSVSWFFSYVVIIQTYIERVTCMMCVKFRNWCLVTCYVNNTMPASNILTLMVTWQMLHLIYVSRSGDSLYVVSTLWIPGKCFIHVLCGKCWRHSFTWVVIRLSVSPCESGIVDVQPSPRIKRGLTLMCKIMQNIANHVLFTKELHMRPFNDFLKTNFDAARRFVEPGVLFLCLVARSSSLGTVIRGSWFLPQIKICYFYQDCLFIITRR